MTKFNSLSGFVLAFAAFVLSINAIATALAPDSELLATTASTITSASPLVVQTLNVRDVSGTNSPFATIPFQPPIPTIPLPSSKSSSIIATIPFIPAVSPIVLESSSITSGKSSQSSISSRPAASGFWTTTDPFPIITPSTATMLPTTNSLSASTVTSKSSDELRPITNSSTSASPSVNSSHDLSTSISTHVTWVTASPTEASSVPSFVQNTQVPISSSIGRINTAISIQSLITVAIVIMSQTIL